jgi:hypothetical protein
MTTISPSVRHDSIDVRNPADSAVVGTGPTDSADMIAVGLWPKGVSQ